MKGVNTVLRYEKTELLYRNALAAPADVREFVGAVRRVGAGGTAIDPEVVSQLLTRRRRRLALRSSRLIDAP